MKQKILIAIGISFITAFLWGTEKEIDINGDFEKVKSETDGNLIPEGWEKNKNLKSTGEVKTAWGAERVKNGKFSLKIKTSPEKSIHVYNWNAPLKTQIGDEFIIEISAKGKGTFGIFFYNYASDGAFLGTTASKDEKKKHFMSIDSDEWIDKKLEFEVRKLKQKIPGLIRMAIVVEPNSEIYFDNLKICRASRKAPIK